jgi:hypothetical protein
MTCRDCETISEPPAPFHVTPRGWAGPSLLAMLLFEKFGQHQPLNRQAERYGREGVPLALSTLADQVGAGCAALEPLLRRVEAHVFAAQRLHGDDTHLQRRWSQLGNLFPAAGQQGQGSECNEEGGAARGLMHGLREDGVRRYAERPALGGGTA